MFQSLRVEAPPQLHSLEGLVTVTLSKTSHHKAPHLLLEWVQKSVYVCL
jgi:hypothetical protein